MTIYLDVVLIENLCMNYIILFATGYLLKIKINHIRLILSALLGGIYSIAAYMQILEIYSNIILKIILSIVMIYIAYNSKNVKQILKQLVFFYLTSFVFGGCAFALLYFIKPEQILMKNGVYIGTYPIKIAILGGIVGFTITVIAFRYVKTKLNKKSMFCELEIYFENKSISTTALICQRPARPLEQCVDKTLPAVFLSVGPLVHVFKLHWLYLHARTEQSAQP